MRPIVTYTVALIEYSRSIGSATSWLLRMPSSNVSAAYPAGGLPPAARRASSASGTEQLLHLPAKAIRSQHQQAEVVAARGVPDTVVAEDHRAAPADALQRAQAQRRHAHAGLPEAPAPASRARTWPMRAPSTEKSSGNASRSWPSRNAKYPTP